MVDAATMLGIGLTVLGVGGPVTAAIFKYGNSSPNGRSGATASHAQLQPGGNGKQQYMPRDLCEERSGRIRADIKDMKETQERMWDVLNKIHQNSQETMKLLANQKRGDGDHGG